MALLLAGAVLAVVSWLLLTPLAGRAGEREKRLPAITLENLLGDNVTLSALGGRPVVVNLFASWCEPCKNEMPLLGEAARDNLEIRFLFADQGEARAKIEEFLLEFPELERGSVLLDEKMALALEFETLGLPITLFFAEGGRLVSTQVGELRLPDLREHLAQLK